MIKAKTGIAFLLAVIVSSVAMSIGLGIAFILLEELKLSSVNKNSITAFFAADSGTDCALYWDREQNAFPTSTAPVTITCNGQNFSGGGVGVFKTVFNLGLNDRCANVTVEKIGAKTRIQSLGQNIACGAASNERTVQRGIEVTY